METRRTILARAAKFSGLALIAPIVDTASPYVRSDNETDHVRGELDRYQREVNNLYALLERRPPADTRNLIWATWANLNGVREHTLREVRVLKARLALLGGVNAVTLRDQNGGRWFSLAQTYSMMADNHDLLALTYARRTLAGLYWRENPKGLLEYSEHAMSHAQSTQAGGVARMAHARVLAVMDRPEHALECVQWAIERTTGGDGYPRVDDWQSPLALLMATTALSRYERMAPTVEYYGHTALTKVPPDARHFRTHIHLSIAEARIRRGDLGEAARPLTLAIGEFMAPVHMDRATEVLNAVRVKDRNSVEIQEVRQRLAAVRHAAR